MRALSVCFSLAILFALTPGVKAESAGKGGSGTAGDIIIKPVETVAQAPIKIIQGVLSPVTKPNG